MKALKYGLLMLSLVTVFHVTVASANNLTAQRDAVLQTFFTAFQKNDINKLQKVFVPGAIIHSVMHGDMDAVAFYRSMLSENQLLNIVFKESYHNKTYPDHTIVHFTMSYINKDGAHGGIKFAYDITYPQGQSKISDIKSYIAKMPVEGSFDARDQALQSFLKNMQDGDAKSMAQLFEPHATVHATKQVETDALKLYNDFLPKIKSANVISNEIYQNDAIPDHYIMSFIFSFILEDGTQRGGAYIHDFGFEKSTAKLNQIIMYE